MYKKRPVVIFLLYIFVLFSCAARTNYLPFPAVDKIIYENEVSVDIENITESKDMEGEPYLPPWLSAYFAGGIEDAEKLEEYEGRYLFIAVNQGVNFAALSRWADNFSVEYDFPILAAARIEKRMNASNSIYPDEEFGIFYETLVKNAYASEYHGTVKEDTYWIKTKVIESGGGVSNVAPENAALPQVFIFYVLVSVDVQEMQNIVDNFYSQALSSSTLTRAQTTAINRFRQNFFEGF